MIIRATYKLLSVSRISPVKSDSLIADSFPGEWYANLLSTGRVGKPAIHFLHYPTMITIIYIGKLLKQGVAVLPERASALLKRNGFSSLTEMYQLYTLPEVYTTNNRFVLGNMNQMKFLIEDLLAESYELSENNIARIEDFMLEYLVGGMIAGKKNYVSPMEILKSKI
jgi:hypothetical protein